MYVCMHVYVYAAVVCLTSRLKMHTQSKGDGLNVI